MTLNRNQIFNSFAFLVFSCLNVELSVASSFGDGDQLLQVDIFAPKTRAELGLEEDKWTVKKSYVDQQGELSYSPWPYKPFTTYLSFGVQGGGKAILDKEIEAGSGRKNFKSLNAGEGIFVMGSVEFLWSEKTGARLSWGRIWNERSSDGGKIKFGRWPIELKWHQKLTPSLKVLFGPTYHISNSFSVESQYLKYKEKLSNTIGGTFELEYRVKSFLLASKLNLLEYTSKNYAKDIKGSSLGFSLGYAF
jgi:hypothetical protein